MAIGSLRATEHAVARAWESFTSGQDTVSGVRPEILASWCRCRDRYDVDPRLRSAPGAAQVDEHRNEHRFEQDVILTRVGGLAALAGREMARLRGIVAVSDGSGRILASYGAPEVRRRAESSNLAPRSAWSEPTAGTNGLGTALATPGVVAVTGPEHWCAGFHDWACAGVAIRDVVTGAPLATLDVSRWGVALPARVAEWLARAAAGVESDLHRQAVLDGERVVAGFTSSSSAAPVLCLDLGGRAIVANEAAVSLLAMPSGAPAVVPTRRWRPEVRELSTVVRWATGEALRHQRWRGFAWLVVHDDPVAVGLRPLFVANRLVGMCCEFGQQDGVEYSPVRESPGPSTVIGVRENRLVVLAPSEIRYAEADRSVVWLSTDRGRLQAATRGLDNVEQSLRPHGFRRVHRRFLVNPRRVAELERGVRGELFLITDPRAPELIPVSRRHAPEVRRLFGV